MSRQDIERLLNNPNPSLYEINRISNEFNEFVVTLRSLSIGIFQRFQNQPANLLNNLRRVRIHSIFSIQHRAFIEILNRLSENSNYQHRQAIPEILARHNTLQNEIESIMQNVDQHIGRLQRLQRYGQTPAAAVSAPAASAAPVVSARPVNEVKDEPEYAAKLVDRIRCPVCTEHERNIVLNCGHTLCAQCAYDSRISTCPQCRAEITSRQSMYYKKYLKYKAKYMQLSKEH
jgi:hypothetical protein